jgi:uncharacterized protein YdhG (YjbR/CyaY superfamily)
MPTFSDAEKAAMKERAREQREFKKLSGEEQVQRKVLEMSPADQKIALAIHELVLSIDPKITTQTWYGMPAYYLDGQVLCFFQPGSKFESRYSTFGFQQKAQLDDGDMFATSFAILEFTPEVKERITQLVRKAIGE